MSKDERERFDVDAWLESIADKPLEEQSQLILDKRAELLFDLSRIKTQIDDAKAEVEASGEYADPRWWSKVNGARRFKGYQAQRLQDALGEVNRKIRKKSGQKYGLAAYFVQVAEAELDSELFNSLKAKAMALKSQNENS